MIRGQTHAGDLPAMVGSAVAFVVVPAIMRVFVVQAEHVFIAVRLGEYACGGNRRIDCIAAYDTLMYYAKVRGKNMPIYKQQIRAGRQLVYGLVHGLE